MSESYTQLNPLGDLLIREGDPVYGRESKTVTNSGETEMVLAVGHPMDDNVPCLAANVAANADGVLLERTVIPAGESRKVPVLARGHAVFNKTKLPAADYAGSTISAADYAARLVTLGFIVREEPSITETQTT